MSVTVVEWNPLRAKHRPAAASISCRRALLLRLGEFGHVASMND